MEEGGPLVKRQNLVLNSTELSKPYYISTKE